MLTRQFPFLHPVRISADFAERLRMLAQDCAKLRCDSSFVHDQLRTAPRLDLYVPLITPIGLHLVGQATGHPVFSNRKIVTSQLWFANPEASWVRTLSRFYVLGKPADREGRERIVTTALMMFDSRDDN